MDTNYYEIFMNKVDAEVESMATANIMLIGKTGVGKSTIINNIFRENLAATGIGKPITQHLTKLTKKGIPLTIYDSKGLELDSKVQNQIKNEIINEIDKNLSNGIEKDYIHVVWYCINASSNRIEEFEIEWIKDFSQKLPVIIVLTQCTNQKFKEFEKYIKELNLPIVNVVSTLAEEMRFSETIVLPSFGLNNLVEVTLNCIADAARVAFINAQKVSLERKIQECRLAVIPYVTGAFVTGFSPIPFSDAALLVPGQIAMIAHLTVIFGVNIEKSVLTALVTAIGGAGGAAILGKTLVANALKFIPGIGTAAGGAISGSTAAILTAALGFAYIEVMSKIAYRIFNGEKINTDEIINLMKAAYDDQLKKGKDLITGINL